MTISFRAWPIIAAGILITLEAGTPALGQTSATSSISAEAVVTMHARGTFDVKMAPMTTDDSVGAGAAGVGRMSIDKTFHGDIEGSSKGEIHQLLPVDPFFTFVVIE